MLHGGGMPVHVPGEGWAKRAGKMPHGAVISHSPSRKKALTQDGRRAGGQAGSGNDLAVPVMEGERAEKAKGYSSGRKKWKEASMAASRQSWIRTTSQQVLRKAARRPRARPHTARASSRT